MRLREVAILVAITGLLLVSGCSGKDGASGDTDTSKAIAGSVAAGTSSPSPSPSASSDPMAGVYKIDKPQWPSEANNIDQAGAFAFAKYYLQLMKWSANSGDTREIAALTRPGCTACERYFKLISKNNEEGIHLVGGGYQFAFNTDEVRRQEDVRYMIAFEVTEMPSVALDAKDKMVRSNPGSTHRLVLAVFRNKTGWLLGEYGREEVK